MDQNVLRASFRRSASLIAAYLKVRGHSCRIELDKAIKAAAGTAPIVVGGPHVAALPETRVRSGADFAVVGEGEEAMLEWVEGLGRSKDRKALRAIRGIGYGENGAYVLMGNALPESSRGPNRTDDRPMPGDSK